jgi:ribosomal protein S18 acetylase RimI-like enzyme
VTRFVSEALGAHDRSGFRSGDDRIDAYIREVVSQDVKRRYALGYVLVEKASAQLAGFYTLSSHSIPLTEIEEETARKLPRYPSVPAALIGWLGRALAFRGQGIGGLLLADAIHRLVHSPVGVHAICADAIDEAAAAFYRAHQFRSFKSRPHSLFLPMKTAAGLFPAARKGKQRGEPVGG